MNGQCSCGYRPGRISSIDCRCVTHRELNERLRKIDPNEGYYQKEIDELKANKQDKLIAGQNITIEGSLISADLDSTNFYNKTETDELLAEKQGTLTAGENIAISEDNVISADTHMLVTLTPTGAPIGGVTDYTWTSEHTYAELVADLDKVAFKTNESGSEDVITPTKVYEALESGQDVIFGMIPSNDPSVPKITNIELIVRPDGTAKATETTALISNVTYTAGDNIVISPTNEISAIIPNVYGFDSVDDMKASTELKDGNYAITAGFYAKDSGGGGTYMVRNKTTSDIPDGRLLIQMDNTELVADLVLNGTVSPEQIGCYNDQTHDDGTYIQTAINISKNNGVQVKFEHSTYYITTPINIPSEYSIDFQGVTLMAMDATNFTEGMINVKNTWNIHNGVISNLKFNQNNLAPKAIYLNRSWRKTFENIEIKNTPTGGYGVYIDGTNGGSGGNQFSHITGDGNYINSTFIYVGVSDNVFTHVDYRRYSTGIEVDGFTRLFDIHGYASSTDTSDDWYTNSTFIKINSSGRIMADELYPDTLNFCFYNYSILPSQIGKIFFTYNEAIPQYSTTSVMFKANNDSVDLYYRWRVESIVLSISSNVLFELIKNSTSSTLSSYLHLGSITGSATYAIDNPPVFVNRILPMNNFTKLGIYNGTLVATGTCQYAAGSSQRDICKTDVRSGYNLIDGYYPYKGINPNDSSVFDGTVKVENNTVTVMPNTNQVANFQFFIQLPAQEANNV